jgi:RNA polymerase sigma-70 factor (ECF subfamily)
MMQGDIVAVHPIVAAGDREGTGGPAAQAWVDRFHAGERGVLEEVYRRHFDTVHIAVGAILTGADRETATHEVFLRLCTSEACRRSFRGGHLPAWLAVVARNQAIDHLRRRDRESPAGTDLPARDIAPDGLARSTEARLLIERFQGQVLPPEWQPVFEARFLQHLNQSEAAVLLGMRRTTLAYRELRIRALLRKFLLEEA